MLLSDANTHRQLHTNSCQQQGTTHQRPNECQPGYDRPKTRGISDLGLHVLVNLGGAVLDLKPEVVKSFLRLLRLLLLSCCHLTQLLVFHTANNALLVTVMGKNGSDSTNIFVNCFKSIHSFMLSGPIYMVHCINSFLRCCTLHTSQEMLQHGHIVTAQQ